MTAEELFRKIYKEQRDSETSGPGFMHEPMPHSLPEHVFHYTNADGVKGIIEKRAMWFTDVRFLNDSMEIKHGLDCLSKALAAADITQLARDNLLVLPDALLASGNYYVSCFCEEDDLLSQWRGYGAHAGGYSIGFNAGHLFNNALLRNILAGKVEYDAAVAISTIEAYIKAADVALRKTIAEAGLTGTAKEDLRQFATDKVAADILFLVSWIKQRAFSGEKEWRLVLHRTKAKPPEEDVEFRTSGNMIVPFIPVQLSYPSANPLVVVLPLTSIRVGPTLPALAIESTRDLLRRNSMRFVGGHEIKVIGSNVPLQRVGGV